MTLLEDLVGDVRVGDPRVVLIEGEPGIGKTRIAMEATNRLRTAGDLVVSGHGIDLSGGELAYGVVAELLRDLVRQLGVEQVRAALGGQADALLSLLPHLADHDADAGKPVDRATLFAAMHRLVTSLSSEQLLCINVDDLQWVDASSLDLITYLATVSTDTRLLIMCTVRSNPDETDQIAQQLRALSRVAGSETITVTGLSEDEVAAQAMQYLGPGADRELVERVQRLSDGIPLYVEELLATGEAAMSTTLRLSLEGRLSGLADDTLRYLQAAAVGEGHAGTGPLMSVSGLDRIAADPAHREATSRGLLEPQPGASGVRFHHALLREAVLNTLMPSELQELHRLWAVQIETRQAGLSADEATTVCAAHWFASGETDRALPAALEAARTARRRGGFAEYPLWQQRALTLWDSASDPEKITGSTRDELMVKTMRSLSHTGNWDALKSLISTELANLSEDHRVERLHHQLALDHAEWATRGVSLPVLAPTAVEETLDDLLARPPTPLVLSCLLLLLWHREHLPAHAVDRVSEALHERMNADTDLDTAISARRMLGLLALERGDVDAVDTAVRTVLDLDAHPPPMTVGWAIWCRMTMGHFREAVELGTTYADLRADPAAVLLWSNPVENIVWALFATGDWDRCWSLMNVMTDVLPSRATTASIQTLMAQLATARGELVEARRLLGLARAVIAPAEGPVLSLDYTAPLAAAEGLASLAEGNAESALQILQAVLVDDNIAHRSFDVYEALLVAARALSALPPEIRTWDELISDAAARVLPVGPLGTAWKSEVACRLADSHREPDSSAWAGVVAAWRAVGHVYYRASAQLAYAESLVRVGDREAAATEIIEGLGAAESLGALPLAEQFRKLARSARIKLEAAEPSPAVSAVASLTSREREVLGLIALGRTNSQIATELFMSPKTASVHVSRIITKLGVSNRTEAAAYAHRYGFVEG